MSLAGESLRHFLRLAIESGLDECVVLSTCNRTEVYFVGGPERGVRHALAAVSGLSIAELEPHLYTKTEVCATCHLFRVVSGLDSAVLGETEIVAQVKEAWRIAGEEGAVGPKLELSLHRALEFSKRVRSETDLCRTVTSVASLAVREAERQIGPLGEKTVLLVGAGSIAERVAKEVADRGFRSLRVLNRTPQRAKSLAERNGGRAAGLSELEAGLVEADAAFFALTVERPILSGEALSHVMNGRESRPLALVDLGVPPNVEPDVVVEGASVTNMDALAATCAENTERRSAAVPAALDLLEQELHRFSETLVERTAAPTIQALVEHGEEVRQQNLEWALDRLGHLSDKDRKVVEDLSLRIVRGLLQRPIHELKTDPVAREYRALIEKIFRGSGGGGLDQT